MTIIALCTCLSMSAWIGISQRVVVHVGESIPALRIPRPGDDGIRRRKPAQRRVVKASAVIQQANLIRVGVAVLPGKRVLRGQGAAAVIHFAKRLVTRLAADDPAAAGGDTRTPQLVAKQVLHRGVAHGHTLCACILILGAVLACLFVIVAHKAGRHPVQGTLHPLAVAIVHESGNGGCAVHHFGQAVLGVIRQGMRHAAHRARHLVAVGIVGVRVAIAERGDRVFVGRVSIGIAYPGLAGQVTFGVMGCG